MGLTSKLCIIPQTIVRILVQKRNTAVPHLYQYHKLGKRPLVSIIVGLHVPRSLTRAAARQVPVPIRQQNTTDG